MKKIFFLSIAFLLFSFAQVPQYDSSQIEIEEGEKEVLDSIGGFSKHSHSFESSLKSFPPLKPVPNVKVHSETHNEWSQKDGIVTFSPNYSVSYSWSSNKNSEDSTKKESRFSSRDKHDKKNWKGDNNSNFGTGGFCHEFEWDSNN